MSIANLVLVVVRVAEDAIDRVKPSELVPFVKESGNLLGVGTCHPDPVHCHAPYSLVASLRCVRLQRTGHYATSSLARRRLRGCSFTTI